MRFACNWTTILCQVWVIYVIFCPFVDIDAIYTGQMFYPNAFQFFIKFKPRKIQKSCYDSAHICPIRAEISTHEHLKNVFILLFVWLVVIGFRQNYFHILPNFGDFGAKMSFFRYIINQKRKIFMKPCSPPRVPKHHWYQRCISIKQTICVNGVLEHGGGEQCSTD